jgi:hypothetical protein
MARTKGSKNRTTLIRELAQAGVQVDVDKMSYEELSQRSKQTAPIVEHVEALVERPVIDIKEARTIIDDTRRRFDIMVRYYSCDNTETLVPERIQEFLRSKVYLADTCEQANESARKALEKLHAHLLTLWAHKQITGPNDARNIGDRIRKMEKWVTRLEKLGRKDDALKQRARIEELRNTPIQASASPWNN